MNLASRGRLRHIADRKQRPMGRAHRHESFAICLNECHNLAKHTKLSARQLRNGTLVWVPREIHPHFYDRVVSYLRTLEFDPKRFHQAHTVTQALDFAATGAAVALIPHSAQRFTRPGVLFKPLTDELMRIETGLFVRRGQMHEAVRDFINVADTGARAL